MNDKKDYPIQKQNARPPTIGYGVCVTLNAATLAAGAVFLFTAERFVFTLSICLVILALVAVIALLLYFFVG